MPELTLPRTSPDAPFVPPEWECPKSNGHGSPPAGNGRGGGGDRPGGGGQRGGGHDEAGDIGRTNWRWVHVPLAILAAITLLCMVADLVPIDDYALATGAAEPVAPLLATAAHAHRVTGEVLLIPDIEISRLTAFDFAFYKLFGGADVLSAPTALGSGTSPSEIASEGYAEMAQSKAEAKAAALTRLGYSVAERHVGALILAVEPGSPASRVLRVGQIVTSVEGTATESSCAFASALARRRPGQQIELSVEQSTVTKKAAIVAGRVTIDKVRLSRWPASAPRLSLTSKCPSRTGATSGYLGVVSMTQNDFAYPIGLSIRTTSIGGWSSGLAMTLGIIDALSGGHLTGGKTVAATGTIDQAGRVGPVDDVRDKTLAVELAGATIFFVPMSQRATALSVATRSLRVVGVRSLTQALAELRRIGGVVPASPDRRP